MSNVIRQMKMVNGDEIVCEVVDWEDEEGPGIVIRNALKIETLNRVDGNRIHILKPWMIFQIGEGIFQTLNSDHVMVEASPSDDVVKEYYRAINFENNEEVDEEKLENYIQRLKEAVQDLMGGDSDSIGSKIIQFPGSTKLH